MSCIPESISFPDRTGSFQKKRLFSGESPSHRDASMDRVPQTPEAVRFKPSRPKNPEIIIKSQYVHSWGGGGLERKVIHRNGRNKAYATQFCKLTTS